MLKLSGTLAANQAVWTDVLAPLLSDAAEDKQLRQLARQRMTGFRTRTD